MPRTLMIVPRMYAKNGFEVAASYVPDDYDAKSEEFWNYVTGKLSVFKGRIKKLFRESLPTDAREDLLALSKNDERSHSFLVSLLEDGAELEPTEDPMLMAETESWVSMMRGSRNETMLELYGESLAERNRYVAKRIGESLREGEVGLLLIDSRRRLELSQDIRIIRVCPFDPADYLTTSIVKAKLRSKEKQT